MGKTVDESKNEIQNTVNTVNEANTIESKTTTNTIKNTVKQEETIKTTTAKKETKLETKKETLTFTKPVDGEIAKDYAKDKLLYSETLEEWTTHLGWDIKADKTTVVKASANGKVKSIKNDPRYGLSIIIEHQDGYQTLYANLLSTEFVTVGEEVKQGQSIGTVGNSAAFEAADETHLHFEIIKNGENIDPNTLVK
ncbi:MAG: M23 family metallopeptidase [Clostridia bacterium]|nr:M23 family metallopeptidase [Clostridia bacterium]